MRIYLSLCLALMFSGLKPIISSCSGFRNGMYSPGYSSNLINNPIVVDYSRPSPNYNERGSNAISTLVMHYTVADLERSLQILTDASRPARVSAHYLVPKRAIGDQRKVYSLVPQAKRAWHAGVRQWGAFNDVNSTSIGVKIVNVGYEDVAGKRTWDPF
ncbi:MAG: N-acetylmuramoyl-L-alanine amidase [Candidatus Cardinium sp.]